MTDHFAGTSPAEVGFLEAATIGADGSLPGPEGLARAQALLAAHPEIATASVHAAAVLGDADGVRRFVGADRAAATAAGAPFGWDPLTSLCFSLFFAHDPSRADAFVRAAQVLLESGAPAATGFFARDHDPPWFESAIYGAAALARNVALTRLLLDHGADPNDEETPYHVPETYENAVMELLVTSGRLTSASLTTLLARKLDWHDRKGIAWLLDHGADPNQPSKWGRRALDQALERDNALAIVEMLLDHGADPRLENAAGKDAVATAARAGRGDVVELFRRRGFFTATLSPGDALLLACAYGNRETAEALHHGNGRDALVRAIEADNPGTLADFAGAGNTAGVALLLSLGFDPTLRTSRAGASQDSALHAAILRGRDDTAKLLVARGAPLEVKNGAGETPLAYAVRACLEPVWTDGGSTEVIAALLAAGADARVVQLPTGLAPLDELLASSGAS